MTQDTATKPLRRIVLAAVAFVGAYFLTAMPILVLFGFRGPVFGVPLIVAIVSGGYVWTRADAFPNNLFASAFYGAVLLGGIGFAAGFFGPMLFAPGANQGPLLGIFITGPAGVLIGAIGGLVHGIKKSGRRKD